MDNLNKSSFHYIPALDNVRGYAVIMVMLFHCGNQVFRIGRVGVDLFFVLSGYLITSLLLQEYGKTGTVGIKKFYARRFLRLLPVLLLGVILANVLWQPSGFDPANRLRASLAALLYYTNIQPDIAGNLRHLWSLAVEEHFYLLWPFFVLACLFVLPYKKKLLLLGCILAAVTLFRLYLSSHPLQAGGLVLDAYRFTFTRIDCILMGAVIAIVLAEKKRTGYAVTSTKNDTWQLLLLAGLFVLLSLTLVQLKNFWIAGGFIITNTLCTLTVWFAVTHPLHPLLSDKLFEWIGKRSYGIYVYHFPLFAFFKKEDMPLNGMAAVALVLLIRFAGAFILAALSYKYVEQPVLKLKKNFAA